MRKLLGIMAVVALLAAPALAAPMSPPTDVAIPVTITVENYVAITIPLNGLNMIVNDNETHGGPLVGSSGANQIEGSFTTEGNTDYTVTITAQYTSPSSSYPRAYVGSPNGESSPSNTGGYGTGPYGTNGIGFGVTLFRDTPTANAANAGWQYQQANGISVTQPAGVNPGHIRLNSYVDSGSNVGNLAAPGEYTCNLYMTLSVN
ncbi:MAG: hypothetical protein WD042_11815 [Phycisphaeraceae bacterium]